MRDQLVRCVVAVCCVAAALSAPAAGRDGPDVERLRRTANDFFARHDRNKDGKLTRDELPPGARGVFDRVDANRDGAITLEEDLAFRTARARRLGRRGRRPALGPRLQGGFPECGEFLLGRRRPDYGRGSCPRVGACSHPQSVVEDHKAHHQG